MVHESLKTGCPCSLPVPLALLLGYVIGSLTFFLLFYNISIFSQFFACNIVDVNSPVFNIFIFRISFQSGPRKAPVKNLSIFYRQACQGERTPKSSMLPIERVSKLTSKSQVLSLTLEVSISGFRPKLHWITKPSDFAIGAFRGASGSLISISNHFDKFILHICIMVIVTWYNIRQFVTCGPPSWSRDGSLQSSSNLSR